MISSVNFCSLASSPPANFSFQFFKSIPSSSISIFRLLDKPTTLTCRCILCCNTSSCCCNWPSNLAPTLPVPVINRLTCLYVVSKNSSCKTLMAFRTSLVAITADIFFSDEPCAIARTLTPFLPIALNILPLIPV